MSSYPTSVPYNLEDVTFLIPVRIDSQSRLENLLITVCYLNKFFKTNIIICESDKQKNVPSEKLPASCRYFFFKDDNENFYRTRINNFLIDTSATLIAAIYDTDVILSVNQITEAVAAIRKKKASFVAPYDGRFIHVDESSKRKFEKELDIQVLTQNYNKFSCLLQRSWGGCLFFNRQDYINAGKENDFFESWGPEDIERIKRVKNLGYSILRIHGPLFHLPHDIKENSTYSDQSQFNYYMQEYLKVCNMTKEELSTYITSW